MILALAYVVLCLFWVKLGGIVWIDRGKEDVLKNKKNGTKNLVLIF